MILAHNKVLIINVSYMTQEISQFIFHCEMEKNLDRKTTKAYISDLNQFKIFVKKSNTKEINKEDLKAYFLELSKYAPRTIKRKIATLKTFFSYLEFEEEIDTNPFRKVRTKIKLNTKLPNTLSISEIKSILQYIYNSKKRVIDSSNYKYKEIIRNIAVLELLLASGIRVSELCSLKINNISSDFSLVKVMGKGNKERIIPITNRATQEALEHNYSVFKAEIQNTSFMFINRFGNPLSEQSVRFMVKAYAKKAKIERTITPHVFRHSFATLLLEEDVDIRYIQHLLGHSSINVTQIYTHVNEKKKKELLTLKSPRNFVTL